MTARNLLCALAFSALAHAQSGVPELRRSGARTRLFVDDKPFVILGGELHNSSSSSLEYMRPLWPLLREWGSNTVIASASWELVEPEEGRYDFALVDGLIDAARQNDLRLVLIWFASWKNGVSSYAPVWVKTNLDRFPRVQDLHGRNTDVLTPLGAAARDADARAFGALMRHLREYDGERHTVLMIQVENEVGLLGDSRDRSPAGEKAFHSAVPRELTDYLMRNKAALLPEIAEPWAANGHRTSGNWPEVFGPTATADEIFMAWQYARYVGAVAAGGKKEYPLPMYVNAWLVQFPGEKPGSYPSGGPVSRMLDVWRAGTGNAIDLYAPDIYLEQFAGVVADYQRSGNALFIPEARPSQAGRNVWYAVGQGAIGFAPFGIDNAPPDFRNIRELLPLLENASDAHGVLLEKNGGQTFALGAYEFEAKSMPGGYGLIAAYGPDDFVFAGVDFTVTFRSATRELPNAGIAAVDEQAFENGKWVAKRRLNGDETAGGTRIILPGPSTSVQRVRLYRHR